MTNQRMMGIARPLWVTIAGWGLVVDALTALALLVLPNFLFAEAEMTTRVVAVIFLGAIVALEVLIGRGLLFGKRRWFALVFCTLFLLGSLLPPVDDQPVPAWNVAYRVVSDVLYLFVIVTAFRHRRWFDSSIELIGERVRSEH